MIQKGRKEEEKRAVGDGGEFQGLSGSSRGDKNRMTGSYRSAIYF